MKNKFVDLLASNAESVVDSVLNDGLLKDLPIVGNLVSLLRIRQDVSNHLFALKLCTFLDQLKNNGQSDIFSSLQDKTKLEALGTNMVLIIDKSNNIDKPKWLADAFIGLADGMIDVDLFERLVYAIDAFSPALRATLLQHYSSMNEAANQSEHFKRSSDHAEELANLGLLRRELKLNSLNNTYKVEYAKTRLGAALSAVIKKSS